MPRRVIARAAVADGGNGAPPVEEIGRGPLAPPRGEVAPITAEDIHAAYIGQTVVGGFGRTPGAPTIILNPDVVLAREDKQGLRSQLYDQMLAKDAKTAGLWATRLNAVLSLPWTVLPAGDDAEAMRHREIVEYAVRGVPDFTDLVARIAYGRWRSPSVQEIVWTDAPVSTPVGPLWLVARIEDRVPDRFLFALDGTMRLRTSPWSYETAELPARKFLTYAPDATALNPYGLSLAMQCFYPWYHRLLIRKFHLKFLDRHGSGFDVLYTESGDATAQGKQAFTNLKASQNLAQLHLVKDKMLLERLTPSAGHADQYEAIQRMLADEIAEAITGHVGSGGEKAGLDLSAGQGSLKESIREDYQQADIRGVYGVLSDQLARWIIDVNVGVQPEGRYPTIGIPAEHFDDAARLRETVMAIAPYVGDRIGKAWLLERLGLPAEVAVGDEPMGRGSALPAEETGESRALFAQVPAAGLDAQDRERRTVERLAERLVAPLIEEMREEVAEDARRPLASRGDST